MKWIIRTAIILIAALLVCGATVIIAPKLMARPNFRGNEGRPSESVQQASPFDGNSAQARPIRRERDGRGDGIFGIGVLLRSLLEIGLVVLPFAVYGAYKQHKKARAIGSASSITAQ